jgi:serine/threonine protein kinase
MTGVKELVAGRYRITRPLGAGGMGRVWLAVDEALQRQVAIKKCAVPDGLSDDEQRLLRDWTVLESQAVARVRHPNVVRI